MTDAEAKDAAATFALQYFSEYEDMLMRFGVPPPAVEFFIASLRVAFKQGRIVERGKGIVL
jgi:hypothetical protein